MAYAVAWNEATPVGASVDADTLDTEVQNLKKSVRERMNDLLDSSTAWETDGDDLFDDYQGESVTAWWIYPSVYTIKLKVTNGGSISDIYEFPDPFHCVKGTYVSCQSC